MIAVPSPPDPWCRLVLLSRRTGVIHVVIAVITAEGENMNTSIAEEIGSAIPAPGEETKATKKASRAPRGPTVPKKRAKSAKKATPVKEPPKSAKTAGGARERSVLPPSGSGICGFQRQALSNRPFIISDAQIPLERHPGRLRIQSGRTLARLVSDQR
jgi:hypothetical protein